MKTIILIRHAHRVTEPDRRRDNGLSIKGKRQTKKLKRKLNEYLNGRTLWLSSPKRRCVETLLPLTNKKEEILIEPLLDEGSSLEMKVKKFWKKINSHKNSTIVFCTHGDWIPVFTELCLGIEISLKKSGYLVFNVTSNKKRLLSLE